MKRSVHCKNPLRLGVNGLHILCFLSYHACGVSDDRQAEGVDTQGFVFATKMTCQDSLCGYLAVAALLVASLWPLFARGIPAYWQLYTQKVCFDFASSEVRHEKDVEGKQQNM